MKSKTKYELLLTLLKRNSDNMTKIINNEDEWAKGYQAFNMRIIKIRHNFKM